MELLLTCPIGSNAGIFRRAKNDFRKVAPTNKCGGNWTRDGAFLVAHGGGVTSPTTLGRVEAIRGRSPLASVFQWPSKGEGWSLWAPAGQLAALTRTRTFKEGCDPSQTSTNVSDSLLTKVLNVFKVLIGLTRFYVLRFTLAGLAGMSIRIWMENAHLVKLSIWTILRREIALVVAMLCAEAFTSGINHIYDVEMDKINKLHYPIASGALTSRSAWILIISFLVIGITISLLLKSGWVLAYVLCHSVLGTLYSVPPFAMKRSTFGALAFIPLSRGCVFNVILAAIAKTIMGLPFQLSVPEIFLVVFTTLFLGSMAALKDIEDVEGDTKCHIPTLASIYGPRKIAIIGFSYILMIYIGAISTAIFMPKVFRRSIMIPSHIILASYLIFQAWKLEKANYTKEASESAYKSILLLYTIEFILFPFI